jgi:hypothetical protein
VQSDDSLLDAIDPAHAARWTDQFRAGDAAEARQAFAAAGARGPELIWHPSNGDLAFPQLVLLLDYWRRLAGDHALPGASAIDPFAMRSALGYVSLVDVLDRGDDFRTRLYGSIVAAVSGFDLTSDLVSTAPMQSYMRTYHLAIYRAVLARGEPLLTRHGAPDAKTTAAWHRLVLPLVGDDGTITRFLVGNLPVGFDGRVIRMAL